MSESVVKRVDAQGRIALPISWRKEWRSRKVVLRRRGNRIEITPMEPHNPSDLFDSIEVPEDVDLSDPHTLGKGFMKPRGNEIP